MPGYSPELEEALRKTKGYSWRDKIISARDLCDKKFPDPRIIVPGLFTEGVNLLASRPKLGKTWLLQQICSGVANGIPVLITADQPAHGDVLYLNLEDGERRAQRRMTKYFGLLRESWPGRLSFAWLWRRLDQGGLDDLREWCASVEKPTLIGVDTIKRVRAPKKAGQTDYDADYEACQPLIELSREFPGLGIIAAHHDRKMDADDVFDTVSGTLGLTGGVDTIAVLKRTAQGISLHVEGRDLVETVEKAMHFDRDTCRWMVLGEAADVHRSAERTRVVDALKAANSPLAVSEIKAAADLPTRAAADKLLQRMAKDGQVERLERGKYALSDTPKDKTPYVVSEVSEVEVSPYKSKEKYRTPLRTPNGGGCPKQADTVELDIPPILDRRRPKPLGQPAISAGPDDDLSDFAGELQ